MNSPYRRELSHLWKLALPIILTNLCTMLTGVVDTMMIGRLDDAQLLAASAIGNVWANGTLLFGMGILFGLDPVITQAIGARDGKRAGQALQSGIALSLLFGLGISYLWLHTSDFLLLFGQSAETAAIAHSYIEIQAWSPPLFLLYTSMRQYLQGRSILAPALIVAVLANLGNVFFNWVFIWGHLGLPAMGIEGAGFASALTRMMMFGGLLAIFLRRRLHEGAWTGWSAENCRPGALLSITRYGIPVAFQISLEMWAFGYATLMAGQLGDIPAAAHTVAMNLASTSFMIPLGISSAAVTRVGNLIGAGRQDQAQKSSYVAFGMAAGVMGTAAVTFLLGRWHLPHLFTGEQQVALLCAAILPIAAAFQIFDGIQVVGTGILRGMGRTLPAVWFNLIGYWLLALPLGHWLAFSRGYGLAGVWWGLVLGLGVVALALMTYVRYRGPRRVVQSVVA